MILSTVVQDINNVTTFDTTQKIMQFLLTHHNNALRDMQLEKSFILVNKK